MIASCGAPVPMKWMITSATARPQTTPATSWVARWRWAPWVAPIEMTVAMQAKIGCGSGRTRTHTYHATSAATAVCRIANARAFRRRRAVVMCASAGHTCESASANCHAALSADLRRALPRDRSAVPAGPEPGLPARAVHGRRLPRAGRGARRRRAARSSAGPSRPTTRRTWSTRWRSSAPGFVGVANVPSEITDDEVLRWPRPACARSGSTCSAAATSPSSRSRRACTSSRAGIWRSISTRATCPSWRRSWRSRRGW